jgi:CelD/BcsL family acetyltransferase involved in cellulose biosynthesis
MAKRCKLRKILKEIRDGRGAMRSLPCSERICGEFPVYNFEAPHLPDGIPSHGNLPGGSPHAWTIGVINSVIGLKSLEPEWNQLFVRAKASSPFLTAAWSLSWWNHLRKDGFTARDEMRIFAIRDGDEKLVAIAPMILTEHPGQGPIRIRLLQFLGPDFNVTELRGFLCHPGHEGWVVAMLAKKLADQNDLDWIQWAGLLQGREGEAILGDAQVIWTRDISVPLLSIPGSWDAFRAGLKRNIRESLRKCYNSPSRDGHVPEVLIAQTPTEVIGALEQLLDLHAKRAAMKDTVLHPDVFASQARRAFLFEVCQALAQLGMVRIFSLRIAGRVVASRLGFQCGDTLYLYYSGFDPDWGRYSVMTTVVAEAIKYAIACGLKAVNLSPGLDVSKTRWGPNEVIYREARQIASRPRAKLALHSFEQVQRARSYPWVNAFAGGLLQRAW